MREIDQHYDACIHLYEELIEDGVCREQARTILPQGMNTEFFMSGSLQAFVHFVKLRTDSHAQREIQDYGFAFKELIEPLFPCSMKALLELK
jgi:thymidylate synthase (FAD)